MRKNNPDGISFLEYYIVDLANKQAKAAKDAKMKSKRR
jgi:hypothetical protein